MSEWSLVPLKPFCYTIGSGATPRGGSSVYADTGEFALVRSQNVYNDRFEPSGLVYISADEAERLSNVELKSDDILLNITGDSVARVCLLPKEFLPARVNQHVAIIRVKETEFDCRFVRYFLIAPSIQDTLLALASAGATRNALTKGMIEAFEVPKPSISEQKRIADILSSLDDKIALNRKLNETLEGIARALFQSWFVDFDPVKAKLAAVRHGRDPEKAAMAAISGKLRIAPGKPRPEKLDEQLPSAEELDVAIAEVEELSEEQCQKLAETAAHFPDGFVESELGLIPEEWEVGKLSDIIQLIGGGTPKKSNNNYWNGDIPWFSVKDAPLDSDIFVLDTDQKITTKGLKESSTKLLREGTTIISARGTVGRLALVGVPMAMNQSCYGVIGEKGFTDSFTYFNLRQAVEELKQRTHGAVFDTITRTTFEVIAQLIPSHNLVKSFEDLILPMLKQIKNNGFESRTLAELRDTLLPKLLSGELSVGEVTETVEAAVEA